MHPRPLFAAVGVALLSAAAAALSDPYFDSVDLQVAGNARVRGTLRSAEERESFRLRLPQGAKVTAQARRKGRGALVPTLDLLFEGGAEAAGIVKGRGSRLRSAALTSSGDHLLRVYGNGVDDGDYLATIRVTAQRKWKGTGTSPEGSLGQSFSFGAPAGAQAKVRLVPARGSAFVPALEALLGPGLETATLTGGSSSWIPLGDAGTYFVNFHDGGPGGGDWVCSVQLRLPRVPRASIDISASALTGSFGGTQQVYGAQIGPGGGIVDPPDLGGPLDGSSVSVPEGSLPFPIVITMNEAGDIEVPEPDTGAGPTIQFGPSGTEFGEGLPATVTIPYDETQFGDPKAELTVYVRNDETGEVEAVLPRDTYDFSVPGVVTFPYPHFSSFVAAGSRPVSASGRRLLVRLDGGPYSTAASYDELAVGDLDVGSGSLASVDWVFRGEYWLDQQAIPELGPPGALSSGLEFPTSLYGYAYSYTERTVIASVGSGKQFDNYAFARAGKGDVWMSPGDFRSQTQFANSVLALRRTDGSPTHLSLAGRWHMLFLSVGAENFGDETLARVRLRARGGRATAALAIDGTWKISNVSGMAAETEFPQGSWSAQKATLPATASGSIDGDLFVEFPAALGAVVPKLPDSIRFRACLDGDVLVGASEAADGDAPLVILVREGRNMPLSILDGTTTQFGYARDIVSAGPTSADQGFRWVAEIADVTRSTSHEMTAKPTQTYTFQLDGKENPSVDLTLGDGSTGTWTLTRSGAYSDSSGMVGAVTPRGDFFVGLVADGSRFRWAFGIPREQFDPPQVPQ